jgi:hypothetical protein
MAAEGKVAPLARALPGLGYALSLAICAVAEKWLVAHWGRTGRELTWFVLLPALFALTHLEARRRVQSTRGYDALAALWGGAAVAGMVSHWQPLGAAGPLLSLVRYLLIALAACLFCISAVLQRPLFASRDASGHMLGRVLVALVGAIMLAAWLGAVVVVIFVTPFPAALAPPEQGLKYARVWTGDWRDYLLWMAWSPDSQRLVGQGRGPVVVDLSKRSAKVIWPYGIVDPDRPWSPDGDGFYFARPGATPTAGVWYAPLHGEKPRQLEADYVGLASCSPDGKVIAYSGSRGTTLVNADGTNQRVLSKQGGAPRWSPDGKHLLVMSGRDAGNAINAIFVLSMSGKSRRLPIAVATLHQIAWVSNDSFATLTVTEATGLLPSCWSAEAVLWDLDGAPVERRRLGRYLGGSGCALAATRDGHRLAIGLDMSLAFGSPLLMLDLRTGRLTRLPAPSYSPGGLAWSTDGRSLALSDVVEEQHEQGYSYVAVLSGFAPP